MLKPVTARNTSGYGDADLDWEQAASCLATELAQRETAAFLGTCGADSPHAAGIGPALHEGQVYFTSGPRSRKSRHLAENPACTLSLRLSKLDLVLEGTAERVTDNATIAAVTAVYRAGGWPAEAEGDTVVAPFSATSAGPPPWHLYRLTVAKAAGISYVEPSGSTSWTF